MVSKSGYLNKQVFGQRSEEGKNIRSSHKIVLDDFPGGTHNFELVVNFCYGLKIDVTATNVAPLYCAANFLEMNDDLHLGNLISKTEAFLSYAIFSSWKDIFQILKSCESISPWAKELLIIKRCSDAIAWKATIDKAGESIDDEGWFKDISTLRIDHFVQVIESIKKQGMKPKLVGSCITHWTVKWFSKITMGLDNLTVPKHLAKKLQRITIESLIKMLPMEKNSISCNFLLHLLKLGLLMQISSQVLSKLEIRIACMLEQCCIQDMLVKNIYGGSNKSTYDVGIVIRVVQTYVLLAQKNSVAKLCNVGRLMDGYLARIAQDINLAVKDFKLLAEALPINARSCDDNLYRAMDMYLKAHPSLTEKERISVCRAMEYHRLSQEARQHAMNNDRFPLKIVTEFMLLKQENMARWSIATNKSNYRTKKAQTIMEANRLSLDKGCIKPQKEINMIRKEVENIKMQLNHLQMCKMKIQTKVRSCIK